MSDVFCVPAEPLPALEIERILQAGSESVDRYLGSEISVNSDPDYLARQRNRLAQTARLHAERVGDRPALSDACAGSAQCIFGVSGYVRGRSHVHHDRRRHSDGGVGAPRRYNQRRQRQSALSARGNFDLTRVFEFAKAPWGRHGGELKDNWDNRSLIYPHYGRPQGHWLNYVLSPYLRVLWDNPTLALRGADLTFGAATAPFRAGTSSSSALVVLSFLALYFCNQDRLPGWRIQEICKLLGQAKWYVGTHGGANDQTTILRNPVNSVLYNRHSKLDLDSTPLPFLRGIHVVLANSLWEVNKTLGGNQSFNMRKGWMQMGGELLELIISAVRDAQAQGLATGDGWLTRLVEKQFRFEPGGALPLLESRPELWEKIEKNYCKLGSLCEDILRGSGCGDIGADLAASGEDIPDEAAKSLARIAGPSSGSTRSRAGISAGTTSAPPQGSFIRRI